MKKIKVKIDNKICSIPAQKLKSHIWFHFKGQIFVTSAIEKSKQKAHFKSSLSEEVLADVSFYEVFSPMPGKIVQLLISLSDKVKKDQVLFILYSMKMEYTVKADQAGVVKAIHIQEGEQVQVNQVLAEIKPS